MKFSELSRKDEIGVLSLSGPSDADLSDPRYDSRDVKPGSTFFAIKGFTVDGHKFIPVALERGATSIVLEDESAFPREEAERLGILRIMVRSARKALAVISEQLFGDPSRKLRLIGVTGTNGKTTTTHLIKQLMELNGERVGLIGTIGISIGDEQLPATHTTPESRDISELLSKMVERGVTTCVMEVSSHALALERVAALDYDIAAFTNLTQDHLDYHHTMDEYFAAKQLLFNALRDTAIAVTNADDAYGLAMVNHTVANSHTYGIEKPEHTAPADLFASGLSLSMHGLRFTMHKRYSDEKALVETPLIGKFNAENVLAAASALYFGVAGYSLDVIAGLLKNVHSIRGRFERIPLKSGGVAVVDYAHTPDALQHVLETLRDLQHGRGKLITVFGCGGDRDKTKRPVMGRIATERSDLVIITNDNPRSESPETIAREIEEGILEGSRKECKTELNRSRAIELALSEAGPHDVVLVAGKGHETYQIFGEKTDHFDDREEILRWNEAQQ